ncbi:MAG: zinc ribbon domain-containing protein [Oscillospiraceae bacterium]|nr:zinc ribbon domain-containing protein [Oscillospiraceae bacterium]
MAQCVKCETSVQDGTSFCPSCGQSMTDPAPQVSPPPAEAAPPQPGYSPPPVYGPPPPGYGQPPQYPPQPGYGPPGYGTPQSDAEAGKLMAILSYFHILFLVPLLMGEHKKNPFVKYHLNQGIAMALISVGYSVLSGILNAVVKVPHYDPFFGLPLGSYTPAWLSTVLWLISIPIFIIAVIGILNAVKGEMKPLPIIGTKVNFLYK